MKPSIHTFFSKYDDTEKHIFFFSVFGVTFDVINPPEDLIDYILKQELTQLGGGINKGYGAVELIDYLFINFEDITLPNEGTHITLISPILFIPKCVHPYSCRYNFEIFWNNSKKNMLKVISPGQFFRIKENASIKTIARKGFLRKNLFGKFGFGEFIVNNWPKEEKN